jgi:hypothetical protein
LDTLSLHDALPICLVQLCLDLWVERHQMVSSASIVAGLR